MENINLLDPPSKLRHRHCLGRGHLLVGKLTKVMPSFGYR
jgi:hypothetical protein